MGSPPNHLKDLNALSADDLREVLTEACRQSVQNTSMERRQVLKAALELRGSLDAAARQHYYNQYVYNPQAPAERALSALWWEWCCIGRAVPAFMHGLHPDPIIIMSIELTHAGSAALKKDDAPHPMNDAYKGGLTDLDTELRARLEDAALCYRANLPRAAMVMVGIAYEHTIEVVAQAFGVTDKQHATRLENLKKKIDALPNTVKEAKTDANHALSLARIITLERNGAGHPGPYERPTIEVEEFIWRAPFWLRKLIATQALA
jgi:hypothetical protein